MSFYSRPLVLLVAMCGALKADEGGPIEVALEPRAIESPALKYRLLPAETEIKAGDAVPILLRLPWEQTPWMTKVFPTLSDWEARPLDAPEWETAAGVLPSNMYNEMKRAAYRRDAHWEYPIQETQTPYFILLPDVQGLRGFLVHGLSAKIRYHLTRGELEEAREGIAVGLANGRHLAQTPFYVNQMVALAIDRAMLDRTAELISQPHSPNLYWALSTLPPSLLEIERAANLESQVFALTFPAANDLDRARDAAEWNKMASQLMAVLRELGEVPREAAPNPNASLLEKVFQRLSVAGASPVAIFVPRARAELPQLLDMPEERVAAMSDDEAGVRWYMHKRLANDQLTSAALVLPPREAFPLLAKLHREFATMGEITGAPRIELFDPLSLYLSVGSVRRKVAALRIVEAVRHYLAAHENQWPPTLEAIADVPIPRDPLTDQAFLWTAEGKTARLKAPPLPNEATPADATADKNYSLEYRLQIP